MHAGIGDPAIGDDHAQIVQRRIGPEDRVQQFGRQIGVETRAAFGDAAQAHIPLDGNQGADLSAGEERGRFDQGIDVVVKLAGKTAEQARLPQAHQCPAQLGLKDDHDGETGGDQETAVEEFDARQPGAAGEQADDDIDGDQQDDDPLEQSRPARPLQKADNPVDHGADQKQLDQHLPPGIAADRPEEVGEVEEDEGDRPNDKATTQGRSQPSSTSSEFGSPRTECH